MVIRFCPKCGHQMDGLTDGTWFCPRCGYTEPRYYSVKFDLPELEDDKKNDSSRICWRFWYNNIDDIWNTVIGI